jgi:hypothetical protein
MVAWMRLQAECVGLWVVLPSLGIVKVVAASPLPSGLQRGHQAARLSGRAFWQFGVFSPDCGGPGAEPVA